MNFVSTSVTVVSSYTTLTRLPLRMEYPSSAAPVGAGGAATANRVVCGTLTAGGDGALWTSGAGSATASAPVAGCGPDWTRTPPQSPSRRIPQFSSEAALGGSNLQFCASERRFIEKRGQAWMSPDGLVHVLMAFCRKSWSHPAM